MENMNVFYYTNGHNSSSVANMERVSCKITNAEMHGRTLKLKLESGEGEHEHSIASVVDSCKYLNHSKAHLAADLVGKQVEGYKLPDDYETLISVSSPIL